MITYQSVKSNRGKERIFCYDFQKHNFHNTLEGVAPVRYDV